MPPPPPSKRAAAAAASVAAERAAASSPRPTPTTNNNNNKRARHAPPPPPLSSSPPSSSSLASPPPPLPFALAPAPPPLCPRTVPIALAHLRAADPRLAALVDAHGQRCAERLGGKAAGGGKATTPDADPRQPQQQQQPPPTFPRLVQTILAQQLSWKAASTIHRRLLVSAGVLGSEADGDDDDGGAALRLRPAHVLSMLEEGRVRSAGVSGAKAAALKDLAERYSDGRLSDAMLRDAAVAAPAGLNAALAEQQRQLSAAASASASSPSSCPGARVAAALLAVRGVGPWSLDMVSMFVLGAPDVLPAGDLGVRKGLARLLMQQQEGDGGGGGGGSGGSNTKTKGKIGGSSLPDAAAAERITAAWRPYRTVGSWLMWRLAEEP